MNEKQLAKELLRHGASAQQPSVEQITSKVLARDVIRIRIVTAMTVLTWIAAVALILMVLVMFGFLFPKQAQLIHDIELGKLSAQERTAIQAVHFVAFAKAALLAAFSVSILAAAALWSLLLTFMIRRATLRQINVSLREISEQLKQLRPLRPGEA
jgi:hypothetical protein